VAWAAPILRFYAIHRIKRDRDGNDEQRNCCFGVHVCPRLPSAMAIAANWRLRITLSFPTLERRLLKVSSKSPPPFPDAVTSSGKGSFWPGSGTVDIVYLLTPLLSLYRTAI